MPYVPPCERVGALNRQPLLLLLLFCFGWGPNPVALKAVCSSFTPGILMGPYGMPEIEPGNPGLIQSKHPTCCSITLDPREIFET